VLLANFTFRLADEAKVALVAALAKGLGADEVGVGQVAVVDDIGVAVGCWLARK